LLAGGSNAYQEFDNQQAEGILIAITSAAGEVTDEGEYQNG